MSDQSPCSSVVPRLCFTHAQSKHSVCASNRSVMPPVASLIVVLQGYVSSRDVQFGSVEYLPTLERLSQMVKRSFGGERCIIVRCTRKSTFPGRIARMQTGHIFANPFRCSSALAVEESCEALKRRVIGVNYLEACPLQSFAVFRMDRIPS
jgi:hypothetical protein